jgi:hypothetical protein
VARRRNDDGGGGLMPPNHTAAHYPEALRKKDIVQPRRPGGDSFIQAEHQGWRRVAKADAFASHSHGITDPGHAHGYGVNPNGQIKNPSAGLITGASDGSGVTNSATTGITINAAGGNETRPKNAYVTYCIF